MSYLDQLRAKSDSTRNIVDNIFGVFGMGASNRSRQVRLDPRTKRPTDPSFLERLQGISREDNELLYEEDRQQKLEASDPYKKLEAYGEAPEITKDTKIGTLTRLNDEKTELRDAIKIARRNNVSDADIQPLVKAGDTQGLYALANRKATETSREDFAKSLPGQQMAQQIKDSAATQTRLLQAQENKFTLDKNQFEFNKEEASRNRTERYDQLKREFDERKDSRIADKEALIMQNNLAIRKMDIEKAMHQERLDYQRQQDKQENTNNLIASITALSGLFLV